MSDSKVEVISRLVQWRVVLVDNSGPSSYQKSDPFKIGLWNWRLSVEKNRSTYVRLFPELTGVPKDRLPIATFVLRYRPGACHKPYIVQVKERLLRTCEDFSWPIDYSGLLDLFVLEVEFLDLKVYLPNGGEAPFVWSDDGRMKLEAAESSLCCLGRMFTDSLHTDVMIKTACGGILHAHKTVLSASSPVFDRMFAHDLKEKESSMVVIDDMSLESIRALLEYLYGTIKHEEFWECRLDLLASAHKYDMDALKRSCEKSLMEDVNSNNVLGRLQDAWLYQLDLLKDRCFTYLIDFGRIYDLKDEMDTFFREAERELMLELFQRVLTTWKPGPSSS